MRRLFQLAFLGGALLLPSLALAAAPNPVTGLRAELADGQVHVYWEAATEGDPVALYHVYYSRASILGTGGQYDDYETVSGQSTNYIFTNPVSNGAFYVTVLGVNDQGEESEYFTEEVRVDLGDGDALAESASQEQPTPSPWRREVDATTIGLTDVMQQSGTGIVLKFNADVVITVQQARDAFWIHNSSGETLRLNRLIIERNVVTIVTDPQVRGDTYHVSVSPTVTGMSDVSQVLPLDNTRSEKEFVAEVGVTRSEAIALSAALHSAPEATGAVLVRAPTYPVEGLTLKSQSVSGGLYKVVASWRSTLAQDKILNFIVKAEREKREVAVAADQYSVTFNNVKAGTFIVSVRANTKAGASAATVSSISLGMSTQSTSKPLPSIVAPYIPAIPSKNPLTNSGPGVLLGLTLSGALAGWKSSRKKKNA